MNQLSFLNETEPLTEAELQECLHPHLAPRSGYKYGCRCDRCTEPKRRPTTIAFECKFPHKSGVTSYRDGCRCRRCKSAKRAAAKTTKKPRQCSRYECTNEPPFRKLVCSTCITKDYELTKTCNYSGCHLDKVRTKNAYYCETHADPANRETIWSPKGHEHVVSTCKSCGEATGMTKSNADKYSICKPCASNFGGLLRSAKAHNVQPQVLWDFLQHKTCEICHQQMWLNGGSKSKALVVDHDHNCCKRGKSSCGQCVRGFLCSQCNKQIGHIEQLNNRGDLDRALSYLGIHPGAG